MCCNIIHDIRQSFLSLRNFSIPQTKKYAIICIPATVFRVLLSFFLKMYIQNISLHQRKMHLSTTSNTCIAISAFRNICLCTSAQPCRFVATNYEYRWTLGCWLLILSSIPPLVPSTCQSRIVMPLYLLYLILPTRATSSSLSMFTLSPLIPITVLVCTPWWHPLLVQHQPLVPKASTHRFKCTPLLNNLCPYSCKILECIQSWSFWRGLYLSVHLYVAALSLANATSIVPAHQFAYFGQWKSQLCSSIALVLISFDI